MPQPDRPRTRYLLTLQGGPCAGSYETAYARKQLRAVIDITGKTDVLDAPNDHPEPGETVHGYMADERRGRGHIMMRGPSRGLWLISYRYLGPYDQETGELVDPLDEAASQALADIWSKDEVTDYIAQLRQASERGKQPKQAGAGRSRPKVDPSPGQVSLFSS